MLERLSMHRLASTSGTAHASCEDRAHQTSKNMCINRCWLVLKGPLRASTPMAAPILCTACTTRTSSSAPRAFSRRGCQQLGHATSCDGSCKAVGRVGVPHAPQEARGAPATLEAGCWHLLPGLLGTAETGAAAALAALLLLGAPAAAAESGIAYDPGAGGDLLKNLAGAAYLLLVAVFLARLLRRRTNSSLSQVRGVAAACICHEVCSGAALPLREVQIPCLGCVHLGGVLVRFISAVREGSLSFLHARARLLTSNPVSTI